VIIREVACGKREADHRDHLRKANEAERDGLVRAFVKLPADRNRDHLLPERSDETSNKIQKKIAVT